MTVTAIEPQKKRKNRYSVYIDGEFAFGIDGRDLLYYKLKEGLDLTLDRYNEILNGIVFEEAKHKAFQFISRRERAEKEVFEKLALLGYNDEIAERVIDVLKGYNYIDDFNYAKKFIEYSINIKGQGPFKVQYELKQKGVADQIINNAFAEAEYDTEGAIVKLLSKKFKNIEVFDENNMKKVYNYLTGRGFDYDDIRRCVKQYRQDF